MKDSRVGHQELLVARSNKGDGEVCRWMDMTCVKGTRIEAKHQWEN